MADKDSSQSSVATSAPAAHPAKWRGRGAARLALLGGIIAFLLLDLVGGATLLIRGALPQTTGTIHLAGPHGVITVTRDHYGVPHISASDAHDVFFAQGFVTAQDRLWQMEFNRRVAAGRLAEILGPSVVADDKVLRTLGLARSAQADVARLKPDLHSELDAYTEGVNAFLNSHQNALPLEFHLLGFTPEPWHDEDSIAYGKVVALSLDDTWYIKLARFAVLAKVNAQTAQALFPAYPTDNPTLTDSTGLAQVPLGNETPFAATNAAQTNLLADLTPVQRAALGHLPAPSTDLLASLRALLGPNNGPKGSNDWVVAGSHTTTGMPLLANDPHLGINYPAIWYEIALAGGELNEIGYSFPGVPGIIIGHNDHIAWGVTNGMVDDTDLYIEQLSADKTTYLYNGQQMPIETRAETIKVSGSHDVQLTVRVTNHGPILNDVLDSLKTVTTPIALQWTALQPSYSFAGFFELGAAQNWDDFQAAVRDIDISQNFVYADVAGHIGYHLSGWLPIRPSQNALLPVDGTTAANDWTGRVAFDAMPHLFDPASGIILTANNQLAAPDYPHYITAYYDVGFRAKRIEQLLTAQPKLSPDDFARIQTDVQSIPATQIAPLLLNAANTAANQPGASAAQQLLTGWDGVMNRDSAAAAFYEATAGHLVTDLVQPLLGKTVYKQWVDNQYAIDQLLFLRNILAHPQAPILADAAARDQAIITAENEAYSDLKSFFHTTDTAKWQWGDIHQAHFDHPLTAVDLLKRLLPNQAVARPGDASTVNAAGGSGFALQNYDQDEVPSMRQIIDMSNLDASRFVTTTGESGLPFADHNFDLLPLWDAGRYQPMDFTPAAVAANAEATLTLAP